jgi:hypothetical protein
MIIAEPATYEAARHARTFSAMAARRPALRPSRLEHGSDSLPETARPASLALALTACRQVREEGEEYRPRPAIGPVAPIVTTATLVTRVTTTTMVPGDGTQEENDEADLESAGAARASAPPLQAAQRHLDDALNLVGLLLDALEQDADTRAAQARTALELTVESLHQAHRAGG